MAQPDTLQHYEAVIHGGELLDRFADLDRDTRVAALPSVVQGMIYQVLGDNCSLEEIGGFLDAMHGSTAHLEQYAFSTKARIEEIGRRAMHVVED